jgi:hypothetical protein
MFKNLSYDPLATGTFADTIGTDILLSAKAIVGRLKSVRADVNDAWGAWVQDSDCSPPSGEKNGEQVSAEVSGASYVHNGVFPNIGYLQSSGPSYYDADTCAAGLTSPELALKRTVLCYGAFGASDLAAAITAATTLHP